MFFLQMAQPNMLNKKLQYLNAWTGFSCADRPLKWTPLSFILKERHSQIFFPRRFLSLKVTAALILWGFLF